eukprot:1178554-Prorocentrum_minimum.AAC.1
MRASLAVGGVRTTYHTWTSNHATRLTGSTYRATTFSGGVNILPDSANHTLTMVVDEEGLNPALANEIDPSTGDVPRKVPT